MIEGIVFTGERALLSERHKSLLAALGEQATATLRFTDRPGGGEQLHSGEQLDLFTTLSKARLLELEAPYDTDDGYYAFREEPIRMAESAGNAAVEVGLDLYVEPPLVHVVPRTSGEQTEELMRLGQEVLSGLEPLDAASNSVVC